MIDQKQLNPSTDNHCPHCGSVETEGNVLKRHCLNCDAEYQPLHQLPNVRYSAVTTTTGRKVFVVPLSGSSVRSHVLKLRTDLRNHSPTGFNWGYAGSGPAQLALAILADLLGPGREDLSIKLHQSFKADIIASLTEDNWTLDSYAILAWLNADPDAKAVVRNWLRDFPGDVLVFEQASPSHLAV